MPTINQVIDKLRKRQIEFSRADLAVPLGKKAFDYGVACGTFKAYEQMLQDIEGMLAEEKETEKRRENAQ